MYYPCIVLIPVFISVVLWKTVVIMCSCCLLFDEMVFTQLFTVIRGACLFHHGNVTRLYKRKIPCLGKWPIHKSQTKKSFVSNVFMKLLDFFDEFSLIMLFTFTTFMWIKAYLLHTVHNTLIVSNSNISLSSYFCLFTQSNFVWCIIIRFKRQYEYYKAYIHYLIKGTFRWFHEFYFSPHHTVVVMVLSEKKVTGFWNRFFCIFFFLGGLFVCIWYYCEMLLSFFLTPFLLC